MGSPRHVSAHHPHGVRSFEVESPRADWDLAEILRGADLALNTRCGRQGLCDGCNVELLAGRLIDRTTGESTERATVVRACQHQVPAGEAVDLRVPARSLLAHEPQVVDTFSINIPRADQPLWQQVTFEPSALDSAIPPQQAVCQSFAGRTAEILPVRASPNWPAIGSDCRLLAHYRGDHWWLEPAGPDVASSHYGLAVDLGTTTVVVLLVDLGTGQIAATASALNAQTYIGDNVLTRINLCLNDKQATAELRAVFTEQTLAPLLDQVLSEAEAWAEQIVSLTVAGNATMLHLLAGIDPSSMGTAPFTPCFLDHRMLQFNQLPISSLERVSRETEATCSEPISAAQHAGRLFQTEPTVHLLPGAAAYVGADVVAGVFSSGMAYRRGPCLLVDVGTNGEIILKFDDHLIGCATAAGPAFEGAGMTCGVRAGVGAISHVTLEGDPLDVRMETIGRGKPIGLCGTAYVDFTAQARRHGLLGPNGRMTEACKRHDLVTTLQHGRGFRIAQGAGDEPIVISEADIASLLQAKAAIAAGIDCLLKRFQLTSGQVETLYLAGGFGFHMDLENLVGCGLLPGFSPSQIEVVGNTSLAGAFLALLDVGALEAMKTIARELEIMELNLEPDFTTCYIDHLWLP